ncbi:hypothetical protein GCM10025859_44830 [Alicyclobacillus fastidiosus]|nr:hypothetical protein GCM10025859_44830 [Alicyclobacillus fastidiosus]
MTVRVRFAPSPTGHLHIGSVRTALFNFLYARRHGGDFVLRIEDTDTNRNIEGAELAFLDGFRWLGMEWDEGIDIGGPYAPYRCMERLDLYREHVQTLLDKGIAYPCFCTDEELAQQREAAEREGRVPRYSGVCYELSETERQEKIAQGIPYSIRFHVPENRELVVDDLVRGHVTFNSSDIGDYVIVKSNGIPTYNFQVVVDDAAMKITHVIRAEEHLSNTPRQILVFQAFGYDIPKFAHLPIVLDQHRKKLSKRDPSVLPIQKYEELGYVPHAIINFLALLGWSPEGEQELFDLESLASQFDLDRISKAGAVFDVDKLNWMANQYFKALDLKVATDMVKQQLDRASRSLPAGVPDDWLPQIVSLFQEQMVCASDFLRLSEGFLNSGSHTMKRPNSCLPNRAAARSSKLTLPSRRRTKFGRRTPVVRDLSRFKRNRASRGARCLCRSVLRLPVRSTVPTSKRRLRCCQKTGFLTDLPVHSKAGHNVSSCRNDAFRALRLVYVVGGRCQTVYDREHPPGQPGCEWVCRLHRGAPAWQFGRNGLALSKIRR